MNLLRHRGRLMLAAVAIAARGFAAMPSDIALSDGYRVSSVRVAGRWAPTMSLPIAVGDIYDPSKVSAAIDVVKKRFAPPDADAVFLGMGFTAITAITASVAPHPETRTIDVTILPYSVRLAVDEQGKNFLPLPRSPFATALDAVPAWMRVGHPHATVNYDPRSGLVPSVQFASASTPARDRGSWSASAAGERALAKFFFTANADAGYRRDFFQGALAQVTQLLGFSAEREPTGAEIAETTRAWSDTQFKFRSTAGDSRTSAVFGLRLRDGTEKRPTLASRHDAGIAVRALGETRLAGGVLRGAAWYERAQLGRISAGNYERAVGLIGYAKEIPVGAHRTVGFELTLGAGTLHGAAPVSAQFSGGAPRGSFLYDGLGSPLLAEIPAGPILRNAGRAEAGVRDATGNVGGGREFFGGSLTLSFPVKAWSRSLLPEGPIAAIAMPDGSTLSRTLGEMLQQQVRSGEGVFAGFLEAKGATPDAAAREAKSVFGGLQPAITWLSEQANLLALKPVVMCDAAQIRAMQGGRRESWMGLGGGVQLVIVTAKLEAGYVATVQGPRPGGRAGAFTARLVIQNLF